jgi:hypothetical protein
MNNLLESRRRFLKTAAVSTGAVLLPRGDSGYLGGSSKPAADRCLPHNTRFRASCGQRIASHRDRYSTGPQRHGIGEP